MQDILHTLALKLAALALGVFAVVSSIVSPVQPAAVAISAQNNVGGRASEVVATEAKTYAPAQPGMVLGASTEAGITQAEVDQKLSSLRQEMASLISSMVIQLASPALPAQVSYSQYSKQLDRIFEGQGDSLDNITASDIPVLPYISEDGGSITGSLFITDTPTSTAALGAERVVNGTFATDPSSDWTLGSGWSWDSSNSRVQYTGVGGAISILSIDYGGSGYTVGDTISISGGGGDAVYTVSSVNSVSVGRVTGLTQNVAGTGYSSAVGVATTGGTGTGLVISIAQTADASATFSHTIVTDPSDPMTEYTLPRVEGDMTVVGVPYRVALTIQNYSGNGFIKLSLGYISSDANQPNWTRAYIKSNGTYVFTLISTSSILTFTPTADFVGAITNVSVKPISPLQAVAKINNEDGTPALEFRPGGSSQYNTFIGLRAGANYTTKGIVDEGFNTAVGYQSMYSNTGGDHNTAFGIESLFSNSTGSNNVALGSYTLYRNTKGYSNTAVGFYALTGNTTGNHNTGIGPWALTSNTTGNNNIGIGTSAMGTNSTGSDNVALGYTSLYSNRTGNNNIAFGYGSLYGNSTGNGNIAMGNSTMFNNTLGSNNVAFGNSALRGNLTGGSNIAIGNSSTFSLKSGSNNVGVGQQSLYSNQTGSNNTAIGFDAMYYNLSATNTVAVGYGAGRGTSAGYYNQGGSYFGYQSGLSLNNSSDYNTLVGYRAGYGITTGSNNIWLGTATSSTGIANLTTGSQNILIGNNISLPSATNSGQLDIGNIIYGTSNTGTGSTVSTGNIGIGNATPYARLSVKGTDAASSTLTFNVVNSASTTVFAVFNGGNAQLSGTLTQSSDVRLKEHVEPLDASTTLALIDRLDPVTFTWIGRSEDGPQVGFIAQEVQKLFPELVSVTTPTALTPGGTLGVNYIGFIAPIIKSIQALVEKVNALAAVVTGFAESFTSKKVTTDELCVKTSSGSPVCVTGDQLQELLSDSGQSATPTTQEVVEEPAPETNDASPTEDEVVEEPAAEVVEVSPAQSEKDPTLLQDDTEEVPSVEPEETPTEEATDPAPAPAPTPDPVSAEAQE